MNLRSLVLVALAGFFVLVGFMQWRNMVQFVKTHQSESASPQGSSYNVRGVPRQMLDELRDLKAEDERMQEKIEAINDTMTRMGNALHILTFQKDSRKSQQEQAGSYPTQKLKGPKPQCVVNPSAYYDTFGSTIPECPYPPSLDQNTKSGWPSASFCLSMPGKEKNFEVRKKYLSAQGINLERFVGVNGKEKYGSQYADIWDAVEQKFIASYKDPVSGSLILQGSPEFLTAGERGYLATMQSLLEMAIKNTSIHSMLVIDDDAVFECNFKSRFNGVLRQDRCGAHVATDLKNSSLGGVLMLGAAIWIDGTFPARSEFTAGWRMVQDDMNKSSKKHGVYPLCYNAHARSFGSFAVLYHRNSFKPILDQIRNHTFPYDHVFSKISVEGIPVRVAFPYLAIQDVSHQSQVNPDRKNQMNVKERAKLHKWNLNRFCLPETNKPMETTKAK